MKDNNFNTDFRLPKGGKNKKHIEAIKEENKYNQQQKKLRAELKEEKERKAGKIAK